jgi:hypothetical protein
MQAIVTKYIGPTNVRGSRVKATAQAGSVTLHWDNSLNSDQNHKAAALALATKLDWSYGQWVSGGLPDGTTAWVCHDGREDESFTLG